MYDQLKRLNSLLPQVRAWVESTRAEYSAASQPVASLGFARLPQYFTRELLDATRVTTVTRIPFPPIVDLGLIEFADIAQMGLSAITFGDLIFVHQSLKTETVHFHELLHVVQWRTLGVEKFMLAYATGIMQYGYAQSPLEALVYDLQSQFNRSEAIADVESSVAAHARATCAEVEQLFQRHGLEMRAT